MMKLELLDKTTQDRMVNAILTCATCGEGCWYARELVCRCSCGGKNHGCLLGPNGARPTRTSKIHGTAYQLVAIGSWYDLYEQAEVLLKIHGPRGKASGYTYYWRPTDPGAPIFLKCASKTQLESWDELKSMARGTYLLWKVATSTMPTTS
jgi:hypothetical protein